MRRELIGLNIHVDTGHKGKVIDETRNLLVIEVAGGARKRFLKQNHTFTIAFDEGEVAVDGKRLVARPEERIKAR